MADYLSRYIEPLIERKLKSSGAVLVSGPKFCGKTTTSLRFAKSVLRLTTEAAIDLAKIEPRNTLIGDQPRLIDEWQTVPEIWNETRAWIDENPGFGQFLLTGSSTPADKTRLHHSGAGRIVTLKMRPMSLYESLDSKGTVALSSLFQEENAPVFDPNEGQTLADTAFLLCRGGWPLSLNEDQQVALDVTANYYSALFDFESSDNPKFRNKKPEILRMILRSYARNISSQASNATIIKDVTASNSRTMSPNTFDDYMDALEDLFILEDLQAWCPNLRSKTAVRTASTRHFVDPSLACCALNISPADLLRDLNTFGLMFEDMAVRDLRIYAMALNGELRHYRDSAKREADAVMHLADGKWGAIEIKLGGEKLIEEGAANLLKIAEDINEANQPSFLMVLTATGAAYRRKDGVYVVPLNLLKA